ncbi:PP2C family protein-serine/threonine phosphatase [Halorhodospira halophila]|uniref:Protein phosphatase 2C domain protein n=1 Tax=Halorhodospira halophila (strain DSM 244 / SL1) TaxID=349124 RepID=A1WUL4_HALHL|nr:protein phosphatase 2C domain-containing protein [Halorhodospira halophila]ABM61376.1 protein phosphatase 2C domain protein [Halorhodospira halophila SL1]
MEIVGETHRGHQRPRNEDRIDWDEEAGVAVLADGMGGLPYGAEAARLAVEAVIRIARTHHGSDHTWLESGGDPADLVQLANRAVLSYTERDRRYEGMGTTLALLCAAPDEVALAHVGDSRIYRFSEGRLERLTRDHTPVQRAVETGEMTEAEGRRSPERNVLERALGAVTWAESDVTRLPRRPGELFLLCSDGLTEPLEDAAIAAILAEEDRSLNQRAQDLIEATLDAGGPDNVSVVLVRT